MITAAKGLLLFLAFAFLATTLEKMARDRAKARRANRPSRIQTEPVVLMGLGLFFLIFNVQFVPVVAKIVDVQLRTMHPAPVNVVVVPFGIAAVVLVASFAKAAWTHSNLEDNKWGTINNYRRTLWSNQMASAIEFWMRVAISVSVVLLQKQIAILSTIEDIDYAENWTFPTETRSTVFVSKFSTWLADTSIYGLVLFSLVLLWLGIVTAYNWDHKARFWTSVGTLSLAFPGILLCISLNYLATGSYVPTFSRVNQPDYQAVMILSGIVLVLSVSILVGMLCSLFSARRLFCGFLVRLGRLAGMLFGGSPA